MDWKGSLRWGVDLITVLPAQRVDEGKRKAGRLVDSPNKRGKY